MICDTCHYCTHVPNPRYPYWWCSYCGMEIRNEKATCRNYKKPRRRPRE